MEKLIFKSLIFKIILHKNNRNCSFVKKHKNLVQTEVHPVLLRAGKEMQTLHTIDNEKSSLTIKAAFLGAHAVTVEYKDK